jgi:hypothetical protein
MIEAKCSSESRAVTRLHGITTHKTLFFIATAVITCSLLIQRKDTVQGKILELVTPLLPGDQHNHEGHMDSDLIPQNVLLLQVSHHFGAK